MKMECHAGRIDYYLLLGVKSAFNPLKPIKYVSTDAPPSLAERQRWNLFKGYAISAL